MNKRKFANYVSFFALPLSILWFFFDPGFEPVITGLLSASNLISSGLPWKSKKFHSKRLKDSAEFNFKIESSYVIGKGNDGYEFDTSWSPASEGQIHCYARDTICIVELAKAHNIHSISQVEDASSLEFTKKSLIVKNGDVVILKNKHGNYAALKIREVNDSDRNNVGIDKLKFDYIINPDGNVDFSN